MRSRILLLPVAAAGFALIAAGCSGGSDEATGEGVPYGADKATYQAAFEDVDPITIRMQTEGTEGSLAAHGREAYADALEDWSGGKITVEMGYANAFVANATEWNDGLADGRLDIALALPSYEPDLYPSWSDLATATTLVPFSSNGALVSSAWLNEIGLSDDYVAELEDSGIKPLIPSNGGYSYTTLFCADDLQSLDDFAGQQISASGTLKAAEVTALGATPVAMPFTDQYEGLQRGVIACALTSASAVDAGGLAPLTPWGVFDSRTGWEAPLAAWSVGKDFWDGLPLVAQQLIWDRLDVLIAEETFGTAQRQADTVASLTANGGGTVELDDDAVDAVNAANDEALEQLADIDQYRELVEKWTGIVEDLGYEDEPFGAWLESGANKDLDMQALVDREFEEFYTSHRPG